MRIMKRLAHVIVVGASLTMAAPAVAQRAVEVEMGRETSVPFTPEHLRLLDDRCALTPDQLEAAEMLIGDFRTAFEEAAQPIHDIQAEMGTIDWQAPDASERWQAIHERQNEERKRLRKRSVEMQVELLTNLKLLLSDEQVAGGWDSFERVRVRRSYLVHVPFLGLRGDIEGVLDKMIEEERLTTADVESLEPIIARWELAIDKPVVRVGEIIREVEEEFEQMEAEADIAGIDRWLDGLKKTLGRIKAAHERAAREVIAALGPEKGPMFQDAFSRDSYPDIYAETDGASEVAYARRVVTDLSDEQNQRIDALLARFERDVAPIRRDMMVAQEKMIMDLEAADMMRGPDESELLELQERVEEMMAQAADHFKAILTPEQLELLEGAIEEDDEAILLEALDVESVEIEAVPAGGG